MVPSHLRAHALLALTLVAALSSGCTGPSIDLKPWRTEQLAAIPAPITAAIPMEARAPGALAARLSHIEQLRTQRQVEQARQLALTLVSEHSNDPAVFTAASRAESDAVFMFPESDKLSRNHAAASSLDYALAAQRLGASTARDRAQLAWALGTTTHLQPMFDRAGHAQRTLEAAEAALAQDPREATALATLAVVNLRLQTLPWIAKLMAWSAPDSSLADAERFARSAQEAAPSREHRQILAKVLIAQDRHEEARAELDAALAAPESSPRDALLEPALRALRQSLD